LQVSANKVHLDGATLSAGTAAQVGSIVIGASGQVHTEPVTIDHGTLSATGGVGLFDAGPGVSMTATQLTAAQNVVAQVGFLSLGADASGASRWTSQQGTVAITAPGAVQVAGSKIDGTGGTTVQAGSIALSAANGTAATVQSSGGDVTLNATGAYGQTDSSVIASSNA
ncbi:hemagglutinin, partial [Ralstonia solanacearum]|nr:hemagglutinin [Ralstonia solanacearum]